MGDEVTYAYDHEDDLVAEFFGKDFVGNFLDIGAYDGKNNSNTYLFAERGWNGLMVEANYKNMPFLVNNCSCFYPRVKVVNALVGRTDRVLTPIWIPPVHGDNATACEGLVDRGATRFGSFPILMAPLRVMDFVPREGGFDYVSIDADGWSMDIMKDYPWHWYVGKRMAVCIEFLLKEHLGVNEAPLIKDYMNGIGFQHLATTKENVIMVRE